ncbi:hypothetical protein TNIN_289601 [Trichonephila inaurata madagascariensis]|uniref:Uncharacterized protein n=1 Tax=Trichonephila inaurata madagascariensis TaxID=2747483 RepID=A0A8X6JI28_9ARAC|nr:hypothetical protein TNIN_289601 [Trichonephila inaurata madagascariensis]
MAAMEDDVFLKIFKKHTESFNALMSKCNMNNQVRCRGKLWVGVESFFIKFSERVKAANFLEACKQSLKEAKAKLRKCRGAIWCYEKTKKRVFRLLF